VTEELKPTPEPEPKPEPKPEPEPTPIPEPTPLDKKREEILKTGDEPEPEPKPEPKPGDEFEIQDVDWDALMEKHPELAKLGIEGVEQLAERYAGGLKDFQADREIVAQLEKAGINSPQLRDELLAKLKAKEDITPPAKPEPEKTFKDTRSERLAQLVPQQVRDPDTEDPGTGAVIRGGVRAITEEEKVAEQKRLETFAESISPGDLPDKVDRVDMENLNLQDDLSWLLFKLQPLLKKHDDLLSDDIRKQILDHSKQFPQTYAEIVLNAKKNGKNHYEAVYHHFITTTKQEQIDAEKKKNWETERTKEEEKKKAAKVETAKRAGESLEPQKTFAEKSVMAKRKAIVDAEG